MELIYYLIPFIVYLYYMNNISSKVVRSLLDTLVTPKFDDIVDYDIITHDDSKGKTAVRIDVIIKNKLDHTTYIEYDIERRIRDAMKYISPSFVMVDFFVTDDY